MKKWLYVFVIIVLLLTTGISAYFLYNSDRKSDLGLTQDPVSKNTVLKAELKDGVIVQPPPNEANPITASLSDITTENGKIRGKITLDSKADFGYKDILFITQLRGKFEWVKSAIEGKEAMKMQDAWPVAEEASERFSIEPKEKKVLDFEMDYPQGAPGDDYTVSVRVGGQDEFPLASISQEIKIKPQGAFLTIPQTSCKIVANNTTYEQWMGPNINPGEKVTASCEVTNTGKERVTAKPYVRAAERFVIGYNRTEPLVVNNFDTMTWAPGETKTVTIELPPQNKPQTYQAIMQIVDQNNQSLSTFAPFRYVVRGASALVRSAQVKSISILKDDDFEVEVFAAPSMDLFWRVNPPANTPASLQKAYSLSEGTLLKNPKVVVKINSGSTVCAENTIDMPIGVNNWEPMTLQLKALADCDDPVIQARVVDSDKELAQYKKEYISPSGVDLNRTDKSRTVSFLPVILVSTFLIVIIMGVAAFLLLKKKPPIPPVTGIILVLACALTIYSVSSLAVHKVKAGYDVAINGSGRVSINRAFDHYTDFIALNGSNNYLSFNGSAVTGQIQQGVGCPSCANCTLGYLVEIWIDGVQASIAGQPGGYYMYGSTTNSSTFQNMQTPVFSATKPGDNLATGTHTVEARTISVEVTSGQISARSTGGLNEGGDHNCGMTDGRGCYGRLSYNFGVTPVGTITLANNWCQGSSRLLQFNFSSNVGGAVTQVYLDKNGVNVGQSGGSPITVGIPTGENNNYTVRIQTAQGIYGGSNTVNVVGTSCTTASLTNTSNTCSVKPNSSLSFNFTSNAPGNITTYYLDKNGAQIGSTPVANPNITVAIPENDTSSYTVRAQTASGIVAGTGPVNVTAAACPYGQFAPIPACGYIRVSWQPYVTAHHYRVIYSNQSTGAQTTVPTTTTGTFLDITAADGLAVGIPYAFIVLAYNAADAPLAYSNSTNWSNAYYPNTVFPDCRPPLAFTQNAPVSACGQITANWNLAGGPVSTYQVRYLNSVGAPDVTAPSPGNLGTVVTAALTAAAPWNLQLNNYYTTMILATNAYGSTWSDGGTWYVSKPGGFWSIFPNCAAPGVVVRINNQVSTVTPTVSVNQNSSAVIDWTVNNSGSCTATSTPANAAWNATTGVVTNPASGNLTLDTSVPGIYSFTRQCSNSFTGAIDSKTISLNVIQYPRPFIQTTGGDIHTNETINIAPNNP